MRDAAEVLHIDLMPVEALWHWLRKDVTCHQCHSTAENLSRRVATFENRHVVVSTTYSKSVLRVAAQQVCDTFHWVDYFPSFEIITASPTGGLYFENDKREVNRLGVAHAMRCFAKNYLTPESQKVTKLDLFETHREAQSIVCDEEELAVIGR